MQAIIITARSIGNDKFFEKQKAAEYEKHIKKVDEIMRYKKNSLKKNEQQNDKISGMLKKAKEAARNFSVSQLNTLRKKQNKILLQKLWKISEGKIIQSSIPKPEDLKLISHRQGLQKKINEKILQDNKFLTKGIMQQNKNKRSKIEIKKQIKEYLAIRDNIRKKVGIAQRANVSQKSLMKRSQSQRNSKYYYHNEGLYTQPKAHHQDFIGKRIQITCLQNQKCFDIQQNNKDIILKDNIKSTSQFFMLFRDGDQMVITNWKSGNVLGIESNESGGKLIEIPLKSTNNKKWKLDPVQQADNQFFIVNSKTGLYLQAGNNTVSQEKFTGKPMQIWKILKNIQ